GRLGAPVWLVGFPVCLAARGTGRPAGPGGPRVAAAPVAVGGGRRGGSFGPGSDRPGGAHLWAAGERPALGPPAAIRLDGPRGQPRRAPAVAATGAYPDLCCRPHPGPAPRRRWVAAGPRRLAGDAPAAHRRDGGGGGVRSEERRVGDGGRRGW